MKIKLVSIFRGIFYLFAKWVEDFGLLDFKVCSRLRQSKSSFPVDVSSWGALHITLPAEITAYRF